jgi:hypothetical protein
VKQVKQVKKVNVAEKFDLFSDYWSPKIAAELNDSYFKLAKFKGEFVGIITKTKTSCSS